MAKIVEAFVTKLRKVHWIINGGLAARAGLHERRTVGRFFLWEADHHHTYIVRGYWKAEHNLATLRITHATMADATFILAFFAAG